MSDAIDIRRVLRSDAPPATVLVRFAVGLIFASEGIQKFIYADSQGSGRFAKIGIPAPEVMGPFVGVVETIGGLLLLAGLLTRLAALPLVINMMVAIASTKVPILLGQGYWIFAHTFAPKSGFWSFLHQSRTDIAMICGALFLVFVGADRWSLDALLSRRPSDAKAAR